MKLLVTGGMGFIGSNFIRMILTNHPDYEIVNLDKLGIGSNIENLKDLKDDARYSFVRGDMSNHNLVKTLIQDVGVVVNFAAETHVDRSIAEPHLFFENNLLGPIALLEVIRKSPHRVLFIQVSTDEVYGDVSTGSSRESDPLIPSSPYASSKAAADLAVLSYHRTYGMNLIVSRSTNNFGPYQFPEKLIPKAIIRCQLGLKVPVYGSGKNVRDWIYVLDHCKALDSLIQRGKSGEIYNISSGNEFQNIEIVQRVGNAFSKGNIIEFVEDRPGHDFRYSLDSSKIEREIGWKPQFNFEEALADTIGWYREHEWWWKPIATEKVLNPKPWDPS